MSVEIKDVRILFPALVTFNQDYGEERSVFVYIDQAKKDVVIPDISEINDIKEFKEAFAKHYNSKNPIPKQPSIPNRDIFNIDPTNFKGDFNSGKQT